MKRAMFLTCLFALAGCQQTILTKEPPAGSLSGVALVDDGTCPPGQVKKVVAGTATTGRQRSCIPMPATK